MKVTEIFYSLQGEGSEKLGNPSIFFRFFSCNFRCEGFGNETPEDESTWKKDPIIDFKSVETLTQVPIPVYGCDTQYAINPKYKHLQLEMTVEEACYAIFQVIPEGVDFEDIDLVFTGGEPMLNTQNIIDMLNFLRERYDQPKSITVETNGTKPLKPEHFYWISHCAEIGYEWYWSISPKLLHTSGMKPEKAVKPDIIKQYFDCSVKGQLKFVVNDRTESWNDVEDFRYELASYIDFKIVIMAMGTSLSQQQSIEKQVANEALIRGYNYTPRMHVQLFGAESGS